jgi:hypothetical protein
VLEDPHECEARVVSAAVAAADRAEAMDAVHELIRDLDERTVHLVLVLLAGDFAWSPSEKGREHVSRWVSNRQFGLVVDRFDDV